MKKATLIDSEFATAHHNMALCLKKMGNTSACIAAFRTLRDVSSRRPRRPPQRAATTRTHRRHHAHYHAHHPPITAHTPLRRSPALRRTAGRAIELQPKNADMHNDLGVVLHQKGDLTNAIPSYRTAISLNPNDVDAHYNLALAFRTNGETLDESVRDQRTNTLTHPLTDTCRMQTANAHHPKRTQSDAAGRSRTQHEQLWHSTLTTHHTPHTNPRATTPHATTHHIPFTPPTLRT